MTNRTRKEDYHPILSGNLLKRVQKEPYLIGKYFGLERRLIRIEPQRCKVESQDGIIEESKKGESV